MQLGINDVFSLDADLSKMTVPSTHVKKVIQKALIEVDEKSTEAAAATIGKFSL